MEEDNENTTPEPSLSETIAEAFDRHTADPGAPAPGKPAAEPAAAAPSVTTPTDDVRQRDRFGKFAPKGGEVSPPTALTAATTAPTAAPTTSAAPAPTDADVPVSWKPEMRPLWDKVPTELRGYLHQRDRELEAGFRSVAGARDAATAVMNEFAPYQEQLAKEGTSPVMAMRTLLQTAHALRTGGTEYRKGIILSLAQQYGVDLGQPYNPSLAQAEAQASTLATERMYGQATQLQQLQQQTVQQFQAFANDPANEFFPKVRNVMGQLLGSGAANDLKDAYDKACWTVPEVRASMIQRQQAAPVPVDPRAARRQAAAGMSVSGTPGVTNVSPKPMDGGGGELRATLEAAFDAHTR